jgi:hypothetical protein
VQSNDCCVRLATPSIAIRPYVRPYTCICLIVCDRLHVLLYSQIYGLSSGGKFQPKFLIGSMRRSLQTIAACDIYFRANELECQSDLTHSSQTFILVAPEQTVNNANSCLNRRQTLPTMLIKIMCMR